MGRKEDVLAFLQAKTEYQVKYPDVANKIKFFIGDVRDLQSCHNAMPGVDYIFHAAALKQIPSCEFFPMEAVKTNVIGTDNVLTAAIEAGVGAVICLSTDKAAYPINAMGITKAVEEKNCCGNGACRPTSSHRVRRYESHRCRYEGNDSTLRYRRNLFHQ